MREIDHRSDIFSFGCILYEAATGLRAFEGKDVLDSLHKIVYAPTPQIKDTNPAAPDELQRIVRRCLAKEPEKRYQSIKDVGIELEELRQELKGFPEFEQTVQPAAGGRSVSPDAQAKTKGAYPSAIGTAEIGASRSTSSAEYVVSGHQPPQARGAGCPAGCSRNRGGELVLLPLSKLEGRHSLHRGPAFY